MHLLLRGDAEVAGTGRLFGELMIDDFLLKRLRAREPGAYLADGRGGGLGIVGRVLCEGWGLKARRVD